MTEAEWLGSSKIDDLLMHLCRKKKPWWRLFGNPPDFYPAEVRARKLRLFGCACLRRVWSKLALVDQEDIMLAEAGIETMTCPSLVGGVNLIWIPKPLQAAYHAAWVARSIGGSSTEAEAQAEVLRDIMGNPFRRVQTAPAWLMPTVSGIARAAYEDRVMPSGELDRAAMLVMGDAVEEAGGSAVLLDHLRGPGPHHRGCWAIDACLGQPAIRHQPHLAAG